MKAAFVLQSARIRSAGAMAILLDTAYAASLQRFFRNMSPATCVNTWTYMQHGDGVPRRKGLGWG